MYISKKNGRNRKTVFFRWRTKRFGFLTKKRKNDDENRAEEDEEKSHNERANIRGCGDYILLYTYLFIYININDVPGGSA